MIKYTIRGRCFVLDEMELKIYVGNKIREERKKKRMSQKELGDKIGVRHNTISSYENATNAPEQESLFKIARALDIRVDDLFPPLDHDVEESIIDRAFQKAKDFDLKDLEVLRELIEKALSLDEKERENFFDGIKFVVDYHNRKN